MTRKEEAESEALKGTSETYTYKERESMKKYRFFNLKNNNNTFAVERERMCM